MSYINKQSTKDSESTQNSTNKSIASPFADQRPSTAVQFKQQHMMRSSHSSNVIQQMTTEEEPIQGEFENEAPAQLQVPAAEAPNNTGLPDNLKSGIENLSGYSMDDVKVHYNSDKPAQLNAHAYAQGSDIHVAPGQEQHLPHEAWHVVQQKQGRVQATMQMKAGVPVNDDAGLENEADVMGAKALGVMQQRREIFASKGQPNIATQSAQPTTAIQMKTTGAVIEIIAPAAEGMESDQKLIGDIQSKHSSLKKGLKDRIFYAIGFNRRQGDRTGEIYRPQGAKKDKTKPRAYKKIGAETFGYIDNFLRWGSDTWIWPNLNSQDLERHRAGGRPMRVNFPFRSWRALAHKTAVGHWGANEWVNQAEDRDLIYKTADSDQDWKEDEIAQGLDAASTQIGDEKSTKTINASVGTTPLVLTTPYHWTKGSAVVVEQVGYSYQQFLDQLNQYEVDQRVVHYTDHPLNIYYPEPTTYFTKAAADIEAANPTGVNEGAAKVSAIVSAVVKQKDKNAGGTGTITTYTQVPKGEWAVMFKFLTGSKLSSDPGDRAASLAALYDEVKVLEDSARPAKIKKGMEKIDQSAFEPGLDAYNRKKNTTNH